MFVRSWSSINNKIISFKNYFTTASWGPLKKKKNPGALGTCRVCPLVKTALTSLSPDVYRHTFVPWSGGGVPVVCWPLDEWATSPLSRYLVVFEAALHMCVVTSWHRLQPDHLTTQTDSGRDLMPVSRSSRVFDIRPISAPSVDASLAGLVKT